MRRGIALGGERRGRAPGRAGVGGGAEENGFGFRQRGRALGPSDGDPAGGPDGEGRRSVIEIEDAGAGRDAAGNGPLARGGVERGAAHSGAAGGGFDPGKPDGAVGRAGEGRSGRARLGRTGERLDFDGGRGGLVGGGKQGDQRKAEDD